MAKSLYLMELQYLGPAQYFAKWLEADFILLEQHENYTKGSYRNRCYIAGANGPLRLTIPLEKGKNEGLPIREVRISSHDNWQHQHWMSIKSAYGKAPYFEHYADELADFYQKKYDFLFDFNLAIASIIKDILGFSTELKMTDSYQKTSKEGIIDLRNHIHPKPRYHQADPNYKPVTYSQIFQEKRGFFPNLSILDLLFCTGPEAVLILEKSIKND